MARLPFRRAVARAIAAHVVARHACTGGRSSPRPKGRKFESSERFWKSLGPATRESPRLLVPSDAVVGIALTATGADRLADGLTMGRPDEVAAVAYQGHLALASSCVAESR